MSLCLAHVRGFTLISSSTKYGSCRTFNSSPLFARIQSKPAASKEQDLEWTRNVILKHIGQLEDIIVSPPTAPVAVAGVAPVKNIVSTDTTTARVETKMDVSSSLSLTDHYDGLNKKKMRKRDRWIKMIQILKPF